MGNLSASYVNIPAENTAAVLTLTDAQVTPWSGSALRAFEFSYSATPTAATLIIEQPTGTVVKKFYITSPGPGPILFPSGLTGGMKATLSAGGSGVSCILNATIG